MLIYHKHLGEVLLTQASLENLDSVLVEHNGELIEVSKSLLAFSPFLDYSIPEVCIIVDGGNVQECLATTKFIKLEIVDFDELNLSTTEKEKLFSEKLEKYNKLIDHDRS